MVHLIVGNTGSGKTTYAAKLKERNSGIIFSLDQWNKTLFLPDKTLDDGLQWFLERIDRAEAVIMELITQLEGSKTDSILDLGFSKFEHREKFRDFAKRNGYTTKIHFLDIPKEVRFDRVMQRNEQKGTSFAFNVSKEDFDFMENWFEKPTREELMEAIIITAS